jgi:ubiquinone/menaquinone biosynthesis C-methylase UbiE
LFVCLQSPDGNEHCIANPIAAIFLPLSVFLGSTMQSERPSWQLPNGVSRGTWDYVQTPEIATEYDAFHDQHPLLELDGKLLASIQEQFSSSSLPCVAIDLGCGTGRSILHLAKPGWNCIAVDLSWDMLRVCQNKALQSNKQLAALHLNMVQLDCLQDGIADLIVCMYSSFGMVRGKKHRATMLNHVRRILKPGGRFVVHVHNRGSWLRDPSGVWLTARGWLQSRFSSTWELGDRIYPYRGLPSMYLHAFSQNELQTELRSAGLMLESFHKLNRRSSELLAWPNFLSGGFIACCRSPG